MSNKKAYIEVKCSNDKCGNTTIFSIEEDRTQCETCGSLLRLKTAKLISKRKMAVGIAVVAIGVGVLDRLPEWTRGADDIIEIYEAMNACMKDAKYYREQRDVCACALSDSMNSYTVIDSGKEQLNKSIEKCKQK